MKKTLLSSSLVKFALWRAGLFLLWPLAVALFKYQPSFAGPNTLMFYHLPAWIYSWANFDGIHYLTIAQRGYLGVGLIQAFFPLYPLLIRFFNTIQGNFIESGLILSNLSFLLALILFGKLLRLDAKKSSLSVWLWLVFPTSFFFGALYNESLFMVFALATFILARKKLWLLAGLMAGLASATRIVGIFLLLSLLWEFYQAQKPLPKINLKPIVTALGFSILAISGLVLYMLYLDRDFADPLYFFHLQADFGAGRQETLIFYPQVVWRAIKILLFARPFDFKYLIYLQEFVVGVGGALVLFLGIKKVRFSYWLFATPAFFLSTLTGTFSSLPRYILVCFPIFIILAEYLNKKKKLRVIWFLFSGLLLIINTALFLRGYWVA